jgi:colanic acid biosynthesis glycosyl transferase WcaI
MPAAVMAQELAQGLVQNGDEVTVVTGYPNHPYGRLFPGYQMKWVSFENVDGYHLIRGCHPVHPSSAHPIRALMLISKVLAYLIGVRYAPPPDVILSFELEPLIGPILTSFMARRFGAKSVNLIFDLYPDTLRNLYTVGSPGLWTAGYTLEKLAYDISDRIVVLSEGFSRILISEKGVPPEKVACIPVWLDAQDITPMAKKNPWRQEMSIPEEKFVILHAGTIGAIAGAEVILEAAQRLSAQQDLLFLIVGDGAAKQDIQARAQSLVLDNVRFLPFQPRERLSELQATADVSLVTLLPGQGRASVPSKVIGYLAAARPVIASVDLDCDTSEMINKADCGVVVQPGDGQVLAETIMDLYEKPHLQESMGKKGREFFLKNFEKGSVIYKYIELLQGLSN